MGECKAGIYKDNIGVTHYPLVCFGGFGQPPCQYLEQCMQEHNMRLRRSKGKRKITKG